ncbi:MAG: thioesterase family protein [Reyranellaceae bacterium]
MDAVFSVDGEKVETSHYAAGPWDPTMQHGAAPSSLMLHAAEALPTAVPMRVARITSELMKPVPVAPLTLKAQVVREGRKLQLCAISLLANGSEVARGTVLKLRRADLGYDPAIAQPPLDLPLPEQGTARATIGKNNPFLTGLSTAVVKGSFETTGPAACWFRADRPIVAGAPVSPAMRAVIAGDFCNGASTPLPFKDWTFLNADLTISLARDPVGEWVLLDSETWLGPDGSGIAFARLGDTEGYFGRAIQSLVLDRR